MKNNYCNLMKTIYLSLIVFISVGMTACGSKKSDERSGDVTTAGTRKPGAFVIADGYIAKSRNVGNFAYVSAAVTNGDMIYFFGLENQPGDDVKYSLYFINTGLDLRATEIPYELEPDSTVSSMSFHHEEYLDLIVVIGASDGRMKPDLSIRRLSLDGTEVSRTELNTDYFDDEYIYPQDLIIDSDGRIYMVNASTIYILDSQGNLKNKIAVNGYLLKLSQDFSRENIYLAYSSDNGGQIARVDPEAGSLGQSHKIDGINGCYGLITGPGNELLVASEMGISVYDLDNRSLHEVFNWSGIDMSVGALGMLLPLSEGRFGWIESRTSQADLWVIRALTEDDIAVEKVTLVLGGNIDIFDSRSLSDAIKDFNTINPHYRIELKNYGESDEDVIRFKMDIVNGKAPDIILLPRSMSMELYAAKGVLTDIYPYLDSSGLKRSDFYENILKAHEVDGQLMGMPLSFRIHTLCVPKSEVGNINGWTLDEMISYVDSLPPGTKPFESNNKSKILDLCLYANGDALVDWSAKGSGFRRDLVMKMLDFANRYIPDDIYVHDDDYVRRIQEDKQMKIMPGIVQDYLGILIRPARFGEPVAYSGYPSENGNGNIIKAFGLLAINKDSKHKDGAWEFIRHMLKDDYQKEQNDYTYGGFPILKSALEYKSYEQVSNILRINHNPKLEPIVWKLDDYGNTCMIHLPAESDMKLMNDIINSADKIQSYDEQIANIVFEEAQLFFSGAKSLDNVVDVMESRIRMYVYEQK